MILPDSRFICPRFIPLCFDYCVSFAFDNFCDCLNRSNCIGFAVINDGCLLCGQCDLKKMIQFNDRDPTLKFAYFRIICHVQSCLAYDVRRVQRILCGTKHPKLTSVKYAGNFIECAIRGFEAHKKHHPNAYQILFNGIYVIL